MRWIKSIEPLPEIDHEDFPKEYLVRVKGDDPRSGWVHCYYCSAEEMRDIKAHVWMWLDETSSPPPQVRSAEEMWHNLLNKIPYQIRLDDFKDEFISMMETYANQFKQ